MGKGVGREGERGEMQGEEGGKGWLGEEGGGGSPPCSPACRPCSHPPRL